MERPQVRVEITRVTFTVIRADRTPLSVQFGYLAACCEVPALLYRAGTSQSRGTDCRSRNGR